MPVSISSPCLCVKENLKKKTTVCLKMLIPLNGSKITGDRGGGWGAVDVERDALLGGSSIRHTTDGWVAVVEKQSDGADFS